MKIYYYVVTLCICCLLPWEAIGQQHDRVDKNEDNFVFDGIVYGITSNQTVEVLPYYQLEEPYSGSISIPQTVEYNGSVYTVTALGEQAFESCTGVTSLTLPATIRSIGSHCFYNCSFTSLLLPDSLRSIGDHAFLYSNVASLHLPACFKDYDNCSFWARSLTSITVDEANPHFCSIDGWLYSKDSITLCIVPDGVSGVINVPPFVRHIGKMAFAFNSRASSIWLPEGVTSIGDFAFNCCSAVDNIVIPSTVSSIGICPFSYCPHLDNLSIAEGNSHYVMDGLMIYSSGYDTLFSCHKSGATVSLNSNLRVLGGFENNTWVRNIDITEGVTDITDNCFNGCTLTTITLPAHMNSIGSMAFATNDNLSHITMPNTLLMMGKGAFEWCMALTSIVIPDSLRVIPKEAFNSCPRLRNVVWGNAVEEIGYGAFWAMAASALELPSTLKKLDDYAFAACANNLHKVTINSQLDTMGEGVLRHANLDYIRFCVGNPPTVKGQGPLFDIGRLDSIVIPCGSLNVWLSDSYWRQFADKYVESCNAIDTYASNDKVYVSNGEIIVEGAEGETVRVFDVAGRLIMATDIVESYTKNGTMRLPTGIYFVRIGNGTAHKVIVSR